MPKSLRKNAFGWMARELPRQVRRAEDETAALAASHMHQAMEASKSGVKYADLPNTSSAPGEAPAKQSGALYAAITSRRDGDQALAGLLTDDAALIEVADTLELGNLAGTLAPRPFFAPAIRAVAPLFRAAMKDVLRGR